MNAPRAVHRIALVMTLMVAGWACSSGSTRDQFYGTDVGVNWIPPDATPRDAPAPQDASGAPDAGDAGADALDTGGSLDAQADQ